MKVINIKLLACLGNLAPLMPVSGQESKNAVSTFLAALRNGKQEEALKVTFVGPGKERSVAARFAALAESARAAGAGVIEVTEVKESGTIAIAIVKDVVKSPDGKMDFDGIVLLKRDGKWMVTSGNREAESAMTAEEKKLLPGLREWQDATMKKLRGS